MSGAGDAGNAGNNSRYADAAGSAAFPLAVANLPLVSLAGPGARACRLRMVFEQWPPYSYRDHYGIAGLDIELVRAILEDADCDLAILDEVPPPRRLHLFEDNAVDLLLAASATSARRDIARFSLPYRQEIVSLFTVHAKLAGYRHLDSISAICKNNLTVLAPQAGWYGQAYADALPRLRAGGQLHHYGSFADGVRLLQAGRADLILGDSAALRDAAGRADVAIVALPAPLHQAPVHLMLNAATVSAATLARIDAAIVRLDADGTLPAIRAQYKLR